MYEFFGGKIFDDVPVYANGWNYHCLGAEEWAAAAVRPIEDGYKALKCYPLATQDQFGRLKHVTRRAHDREFTELAYQRVKKLVEFVGSDVEIMLDLSGGLTTGETIRLCQRYEDLGIRWLEEPCDAFDVGALKRIADSTNMSIAAGERLYTRYGFRKVLSVTLANFMTLEIYPYFSDSPNFVNVLENPPEARIKDGRLKVEDKLGLGVALAKDNVKPFLWAECKL